MGVPRELHELLFEGTADVEVVPDDGADDKEAGEGNGEDAECVGCCCESGVWGAIRVAGARSDEAGTELAHIIQWGLPDRATRLDRSV